MYKEVTMEARWLLSCIYRLLEADGLLKGGKIFYPLDVILDVLRGGKKVRKKSYESISVYGIGRKIELSVWKLIIRRLIFLQFIEKGSRNSKSKGSSIRLTQTGWEWLKNKNRHEIFLNPAGMSGVKLSQTEMVLCEKETRARKKTRARFGGLWKPRKKTRVKKSTKDLTNELRKNFEDNFKNSSEVTRKTRAKKRPLTLKEINELRKNRGAAWLKSGTSNEVGKKLNKKGYRPPITY
ncbi:RQC domain-containing protein [Verrucomicrobia bacterium]|nr:RQC domain-containing protein [Verrucomicrobiota bacterium]